ncbi:MAG: CinA family protein [Chitinivibrionia bacterium]|nr:CinA family protein [Chitinivibrionia bacterium]
MELLSQEYNKKIAKIGVLLTERNERVSTAESCTGGLISAAFTQQAGASAWYFGSIIAYDNSIKHNILGVSSDILQKYGAVSKECVEKMLIGAQKMLATEWAVAVSGIAGPSGATPDKPIGTVFVGISHKGEILEVSHNQFSGNRSEICLQSVQKAVDMLLIRLEINR